MSQRRSWQAGPTLRAAPLPSASCAHLRATQLHAMPPQSGAAAKRRSRAPRGNAPSPHSSTPRRRPARTALRAEASGWAAARARKPPLRGAGPSSLVIPPASTPRASAGVARAPSSPTTGGGRHSSQPGACVVSRQRKAAKPRDAGAPPGAAPPASGLPGPPKACWLSHSTPVSTDCSKSSKGSSSMLITVASVTAPLASWYGSVSMAPRVPRAAPPRHRTRSARAGSAQLSYVASFDAKAAQRERDPPCSGTLSSSLATGRERRLCDAARVKVVT